MPRRIAVLGLLAAGLWGCGSTADTVVQGGGATETGNGVHIRVVGSDGKPVPSIPVDLVRTDTWLRDVAATGSPKVVHLVTNASGTARIDSLPTGSWAAQSESDAQAGRIVLTKDSVPQQLSLQPVHAVSVRLSGNADADLRVVGTDWRSRPDALGRSVFLLPPGPQALVTRHDTDLTPAANLAVAASPLDTTISVIPGRLLLDDFATRNGHTSLSLYTGIGHWYTNSWGTRIYSELDSLDASYQGLLSMRYVSSDTNSSALAGIAFADQTGFRTLDFSKLDSLCFDARGNGKVDLYFIQYGTNGAWMRSVNSAIAGLDTAWNHYCIAPAQFDAAAWDSVKTRADDITFMARRGDFLQLRNLVLWGVPLQDLGR